jgi:hypothetical protein
VSQRCARLVLAASVLFVGSWESSRVCAVDAKVAGPSPAAGPSRSSPAGPSPSSSRGDSTSPDAAAPRSFSLSAVPPRFFDSPVGADTDLLVLPFARRPSARPTVVAVTSVRARPDAVAAVVLNPQAMREAFPALVRSDVVDSRPGPRADAWPDRLIAWEIEIPLFNLAGRGWLRQRDDGAELTLIEGAFAPGHIRFRSAAAANSGMTITACEIQIEARSANWLFRRVAQHDPWAETALSAATAWVLARGVALRVEAAASGAPPARPRGGIQPPSAGALDGSALGASALASLRSGATLATVRRARGGRLAWASVGVMVPGSAATVLARLALPETWRVFPGWKSVERRPETGGIATRKTATSPARLIVDVEDNVAFLDLDAVWSVSGTSPVRATAIEGDIRGAVLGWEALPGDLPSTSLAVLSMHPRLDAAGFIQRKLIAAEPLLEHAFAIAMTYANAAAVADSLDRPP